MNIIHFTAVLTGMVSLITETGYQTNLAEIYSPSYMRQSEEAIFNGQIIFWQHKLTNYISWATCKLQELFGHSACPCKSASPLKTQTQFVFFLW